MYKIIISRLRRGTRRSSGNTCSIKKLLCMESRKDLYDKNASEKGVDMVSLDRDTMIRISQNPGWYQALYKSYGCAPNARELYDIAHKKMKNEVYYNMGKNDAEGMAEKETMEAAKKRVESLERVKDIVDKFDDGDMVAQSLLEPETYEQVYKPTVETLSQGNTAVKKSARDSALILSKMAENFHKNYGVPLKMAAVKIAEESQNRDAQVYNEPAFDVSRAGITSLKEFCERIKRGKAKGEAPNKIKYTSYTGVIFPEERLTHVMQTYTEITEELLNELEDQLVKLDSPEISTWEDGKYIGQYGGVPVLGKIHIGKDTYKVTLKFTSQGDVYFDTAYKVSNKKTAPNAASRLLLVDDKQGVSEGQPHMGAVSIQSIRNYFRKVKYHQMAGENAKTANMKALKQAKRMLQSGESIEEISKETGWFVGMDGRWRFYIPDHLDQFNSRK